MKRLGMLFVMLAVLGVCSQSYGYVLVYDVLGQVKAVDTVANTMNRTMVRGTLVVDIDEAQGIATEGMLVLYNRATRGGQGLYTVSEAVGITIYGNSVAAVMDTGWMGGQIIMTGGRKWNKNIGLSEKKNIANAMDGSVHFDGGMLFNANESLVGAGVITATLNLQQTRAANKNSDSVSVVVDDIISWLQGRGFTEFVMEEPMPA
jgi:hypothetical protein